MPFIDGPDCRLWVEVVGRGGPVSVWTHGITSSIEEIAPMAAATPGTRVLFDLRGHGHSGCPPVTAGYDHAAVERDLRSVADRFDATRAFGVSVGADALVRIMASEPDRFERAVLFIPSALDAPNLGAAHFTDVADALEKLGPEEYAEQALRDPVFEMLFVRRPQWRDLVHRRILRMNADGVPRALRAYVSASPPLPNPTPLAGVATPTLILAHEDDPVHDIAIARRLASILPNATLRVWDEPLAMLDDMKALAEMVGGFLR